MISVFFLSLNLVRLVLPLQVKIIDVVLKGMAGESLRLSREDAGLSECQLADLLGTYRQQIVRWQRCEMFVVEPEVMRRIVEVLKIKV